MSEEKKNVKLNEKEENGEEENKTNKKGTKEDVKTQYCNPADCNMDCMHGSIFKCDAQVTGLF